MATIIDNGVELEILPQEAVRLRKRDLIHYCREHRCYHIHEDLFAVKHKGLVDGEQLYWNNQMGWVDLSHAAFYTEEEIKTVTPALPGEWEKILCY